MRKPARQRFFWPQPKLGKPAQYLIFGAGILLAFFLIRNIVTLVSSQDRIKSAEHKVEELRAENRRLQEEWEKASSEEFFEKQAREKLGLAREGETVVVLPEEDLLRALAPEIGEDGLPEELPNWKLWLRLFF